MHGISGLFPVPRVCFVTAKGAGEAEGGNEISL